MTRFRLGLDLWMVLGLWVVGMVLLVLSFLHGGTWALGFSLAALVILATVAVVGVQRWRREVNLLRGSR